MKKTDSMKITDSNGRQLRGFRIADNFSGDEMSSCRFSVIFAHHNNNVILVYDRSRALWELPGGRLEMNETPEECAKRELLEESGVKGEDFQIVGALLLEKNKKSTIGILYCCKIQKLSSTIRSNEIAKVTYQNFKQSIPWVNPIDRWLINITLNTIPLHI